MTEFLCHQGYSVRNQERGVNAFPHLHPAIYYGRKNKQLQESTVLSALCGTCLPSACSCWRRSKRDTAMFLKSREYFIIHSFPTQAFCGRLRYPAISAL